MFTVSRAGGKNRIVNAMLKKMNEMNILAKKKLCTKIGKKKIKRLKPTRDVHTNKFSRAHAFEDAG